MRIPSWEGDWSARLAARLKERGFSTVSAFADSRPAATQKELADELASVIDADGVMVGDLAPVQVVWALLDEAKEARAVEVRARDLFVRDLALTDGWPPPRGAIAPEKRKPLVRALTSWAGDIGSHLAEYDQAAQDFVNALLIDQSIPVGWLPSTVDDPILVELFRRHWREPSDENNTRPASNHGAR